jgi:tetratricopeptide (TPR) repeat protein
MSISGNPLRHQLLFPCLLVLLLCGSAFGQHRLIMADRSVREGEIVGATATTVQLRVAQGEVGVPKGQIASVEMPVPAQFTEGLAAWEQGETGKALGTIRPLVEKFKGLPTDWAQRASALLGDILMASNDAASAEKAYLEFQKLYPGTESRGADVGMARVMISKKDFAGARAKLEPIVEEAAKKKSVSRLEGASYGQASLLLGEILESEEKYAEALESYLRTVTLYHHDARTVQIAQQKADALRAAHQVMVP